MPGTPLTDQLAPITLENASQVSGLTEWRESAVSDLEWMPGGRILAVANTSTINLYDVNNRRILRTLYPQREGIVDVAVSPTGDWLVAGMLRGSEKKSYASSIELWLGPDWKPLGVLFGLNEGLAGMTFSPNGKFFTPAFTSHNSYENRVDFWNVLTWTITGTLQTGPAFNLAYSPDSNLLAISPDQYAIRMWDLKEKKFLYEFPTSFTGAVNAMAFSPDGVTFASGHYDGTIRLWDLRTGDLFLTFATEEVIQSLEFSPDGRLLATGGSYQNDLVRLWSAGSGELLHTLDGHTNGVIKLLFSPDSHYLVSASYDGVIRLWGIRPF
jgi:WD40 repeat protein